MKKSVYFAAAALVMMAGCAKNEVNPVETNQEVTFQAVVGKVSAKALITEATYPTDETFGSAAFYYESEDGFTAAAKTYIDESQVKHFTNEWAVTNSGDNKFSYYWPKNGYLTFFSYSPYDELNVPATISAASGVVITDWDVDAKQEVDVMVADVKHNQTQSPVATVFRHKLAQVAGFTFKTDNTSYPATPQTKGGIQFLLKNVSINDIYQKGTYTSGNNVDATNKGSWNVDKTAPKDYIWHQSENGTDFTNNETANNIAKDGTNDYLLVMPQAFTADGTAEISISYVIRHWWGTGENDYTDETIDVSKKLYDIHQDTGWEMNKKYTYTITIGLDEILWAPEVVVWDGATDSAINDWN